MSVDGLSTVAKLRGADGVRGYLQENRARLRDLFMELAAPALLHQSVEISAWPIKTGLLVETLPLTVQRELWSALVRWHAALPEVALRGFAARFVATAEMRLPHEPLVDPVSVDLAQLLLHTLRGDDETEGGGGETNEVEDKLRKLVFLPRLTIPGEVESKPSKKRRRPSQDEPAETPVPIEIDTDTEKRTSPVLSSEVETRLSAIAAQLVALGAPDVSADQSSRTSELVAVTVDALRQVMNQVHATQQDNEVLFAVACEKLQVSSTSDDALFQITNGLMEANWSSRYAAIYLDAAVLPRVRSATSVISRVLLQTILLYAKPSYGTALTDGLLVPLLSMPLIGPAQGEAVTRLLREKCVPVDEVDVLLRRSLESKNASLLTNEATILVFQNALNMKPTLAASTVELLVGSLVSALQYEPTREATLKAPKFTSLVFTLVSKYGVQCKPHVEELEGIASQLTSVMAKSALRILQKLKN